MEEKKIEDMLLSIIEKIEKRDDLLIKLTKEIALLRLELKENHKLYLAHNMVKVRLLSNILIKELHILM